MICVNYVRCCEFTLCKHLGLVISLAWALRKVRGYYCWIENQCFAEISPCIFYPLYGAGVSSLINLNALNYFVQSYLYNGVSTIQLYMNLLQTFAYVAAYNTTLYSCVKNLITKCLTTHTFNYPNSSPPNNQCSTVHGNILYTHDGLPMEPSITDVTSDHRSSIIRQFTRRTNSQWIGRLIWQHSSSQGRQTTTRIKNVQQIT